MRSNHLAPQHTCLICSQVCSTKSVLKTHLLLHSYTKKFQCQLCPKQFSQPAGLKIHLAQTHHQRSFPCPDCPRVYRSYARLYQHRYIHDGASKATKQNYICATCGYNAFTAKLLASHQVKHTKEKPFSCEICKSEFGWERALNFHMKTKHPNKSVKEWNDLIRPIHNLIYLP